MFLFCAFWVPLFYLYRRSISGEGGPGGVWALILGSITAILRFFAGNLIESGGFGFSRWMSAFVDIVGLPVLLPIIVYSLILIFRIFSGNVDFAGFTLLWLIPSSVLQALGWSSQRSPLLMILVPLLWTALATGIPFFVKCMLVTPRWQIIAPCSLCILALPIAAVSSYWAFFSHQMFYGSILFFVTMVPMLLSVILDIMRAK